MCGDNIEEARGADLDDLALCDEQRHLDDMPSLQGRCFGAACTSHTARARPGVMNSRGVHSLSLLTSPQHM